MMKISVIGLSSRIKIAVVSGLLIFLTIALPVGPVSASAPASQDGPVSINILKHFDGLNELTVQGSGASVPDVQIAAGPGNYVVELTNIEVGIYSKQSYSLVAGYSFCTFFGTGCQGGLGDPQVLFDSGSQRWFASVYSLFDHSVVIAVSSSSDPTIVPWNVYTTLLTVGSNNCPDFPRIGVSDDKFTAAANVWSANPSSPSQCPFNFVDIEYWVVKKSDLVSGVQNPLMQTFHEPSISFISPVESGFTSTQYMVGGPTSSSSYTLFSITGVPPNVPTPTKTTISLSTPLSNMPYPVEPGGGTLAISAGIVLTTSWDSSGKLWFGVNDGCTPPLDSQPRTCIRLVEVSTINPGTVIQDFAYGAAGMYSFFPALHFDASGNLVVLYGYSSSGDYPSLAVTGQGSTSMLRTLAPSRILWAGSAPDNNVRYGDYFGASTEGNTVWVAGEYHSNVGSCSGAFCWSTHIGQAQVYGVGASISKTAVTHAYSGGVPLIHRTRASLTLYSVGSFSGTVYAGIAPNYPSELNGPVAIFPDTGTNTEALTIPAGGSVTTGVSFTTCHATPANTYTFTILVRTPDYGISGAAARFIVTVTGTDSDPSGCT